FESSILRFLESAAVDPAVLAIKRTIYRTGRRSPIIQALKQAARRGKGCATGLHRALRVVVTSYRDQLVEQVDVLDQMAVAEDLVADALAALFAQCRGQRGLVEKPEQPLRESR